VSAATKFGPRGSTVFVENSDDTPLVWFDVAIRGGAAADPIGTEGIHRHAALLARRGAGRRDRAALDEALDALGAALDVSVGRDTITLSGLCLDRNLDQVIDLAADVLAAPRCDDVEHARLQRETPQLLDEVRDDDAALATRWFDWACSPGHPYGRTALGTEASIARITQTDASALWKREVVPQNLVIGVAGNVDDDRAEALVERLVERLPSGGVPPLPGVDGKTAPAAGRRLALVDKPDRTQAQLRLGHLACRFGDPDALPLMVAEAAFGGMFSSRLMQEIRVKRGWSYGAGCALRRSRGPHWFEIWMATAITAAADAVALTLDLYADLAARGPSPEEVEFARGYLVGAMPFQTATARLRMQLAVRDATYDLPFGYTAELPRRLAGVDVDQVRAACARQLRPAEVVTVAVTTADETRAAFERCGAGPISVVAHDEY
jgi:zinc protease